MGRLRDLAARPVAMPAAVFLLAVLVHVTALGNDFVYDDFPELVANPIIDAPFSVSAVFSAEYWAGFQGRTHTGYYRPVPLLLQKIVHDLFGKSPLPYHLLVILLHALLAGLITDFLRRRCDLRTGALLAGALFAVHTANTEAAVCSYGLKEVLAGLLPFSALLVYSGWSASRPTGRILRLASASALLAAGLLSKESSVGFFLALPAWDLFRRVSAASGAPARLRPALLHSALFAATLFTALSFRAPVLGGLFETPPGSPINNPLLEEGPFARFATVLRVAWLYLRILILPLWLSHDYSAEAIPVARSLLQPDVLAGIGVLAGLGMLLVRAPFLRPPAGVGAIIVASSYLPSSNLVLTLGTLFSERFLYIPSIGLCLVLAPYLERLGRSWLGPDPSHAADPNPTRTKGALGAPVFLAISPGVRRTVALGLAVAVLGGLSVLTLIRCRVYMDDDAMNVDSHRHYPRNVSIQDAMASYWLRRKDYGRADELLRGVESRRPDMPFLTEKRARLLLAQGKKEEGMKVLEEASRRAEADVITFRDYAERLAANGKVEEAIDALSAALKDPFGDYRERARVRELRGALLLHRGKTRQALVDLRLSCAIYPLSADAWSDLAKALFYTGAAGEGRAAAERALALQPGNREMLAALARDDLDRRDFPSATARLRRIVELDPDDIAARDSLGGALIALGDLASARGVFEEVLRRAPHDRHALASLGSIEEGRGNRDAALRLYDRFLSTAQPDDDLTRRIRGRAETLRAR